MAFTVYFNASAGLHDNSSVATIGGEAEFVNESTVTAAAHCTLFGDADQQQQWKCDTMVTLRRISATLSLIGCAAIISTIWLFRRYQLFVQRLLLYLSISGAISSIAYWMGDRYQDGPTCNFEAFLLTFGEWSLLFWTSLLVFNACTNTLWGVNADQNEWMYHVIGWAMPFAISTSPLFGDEYGPAGAWCWIKQNNWSWRVGLWNAPFCALILLQLVVIVIVVLVIRKQTRKWQATYNLELERATIVINECVKPLLPYPIIFLFTSIIPVINRINDTVNPESPVFAIEVLQCIICPLSGALNAIVFMADKEARSKLTWLQIKAAWQRNTNQQRVIREYPIMYRMDDNKVCNGENKVIQFLRYDRVEYQKLQGMACKSQSCLEVD